MDIYDLTNCPYSQRNGYYGGAAGDKDAHHRNWINVFSSKSTLQC